jgi:hypothetical protein
MVIKCICDEEKYVLPEPCIISENPDFEILKYCGV